MRRTFNNGIGLIAVVPESAAADVRERFRALNEEAFIIGEVIERKGAGPRVKWDEE